MQIVVILGVMRMLFALLSWLLHAVKWMLVVASIASLVTVGVKYLHSASAQAQTVDTPPSRTHSWGSVGIGRAQFC